MKPDVTLERLGPVARITLDRPDKLNAIGPNMVTELHKAMDAAEADDEVRVILLCGAGKSFSAGFDLGTMEEGASADTTRALLQEDFDIIMRFWRSPKPTVSAVQGYVLGGGFELAMSCDVTIAADDALFGEPEPKFGSGIVALLLPCLAGPKLAREMLLFGNDRVSAERAETLGLVNRVVPRAELESEAMALARRAALLDATAVRLTKVALNQTCDMMGFDRAMRAALEIDVEIETTETDESRNFKRILNTEGVKAAIAWREARFATPTN